MGLEDKKITFGFGKIGLLGAIFIVFLIFKLGEIGVVANWSWWWVTSPLWVPFGIILGIFIIWLLLNLAIIFIEHWQQKRSGRRYRNNNSHHYINYDNTVNEDKPNKKSKFQQRLESLAKPKSWREHNS